MRMALRWAGYVGGFVLLLLLVAIAWVWFASSRAMGGTAAGVAERLERPSPQQLADAPRQLKILGCVACHGEGLRGKLMFEEANVARVHAPNLTLIAAGASDQQLARAIRQGIGVDGRPLFIMPSSQYGRLTDAEVGALIAAIRAEPRGGSQTPPIAIGLLGRVGIVTGKLNPQPQEVERFRANMPADLGPGHGAGRHMAMVNCAECHGPSFRGGEPKPGTTAPDLAIVGSYDLDQFRTMMRTGVAPGNRKLGLMGEVARSDFSHFSDEEVAAIHAYLAERANRAR